MNIVITALLLIIALCMVFGRPLKLDITHKYDVPQPTAAPVDEEQKKFDEEQKAVFDDVISKINDALGVNADETDSART